MKWGKDIFIIYFNVLTILTFWTLGLILFILFHLVIFNLLCFNNYIATEKTLTKCSLERLFMCLFVWFLEMSPLPHLVQCFYFISLFILMCILEWFLEVNFLTQNAQGLRFSQAWLFIWLFMWLLEMDPLSTRAQWCVSSLVWIIMWHIVWFMDCCVVWCVVVKTKLHSYG